MIVIQNAIGDDYVNLCKLTNSLWSKYCAVFNYQYQLFNLHDPSNLPPNWSKLTCLINVLKNNDKAILVDCDVFPVDFTTPIPGITKNIGLVEINRRRFKYNTGVILANSAAITDLQNILTSGPVLNQILPGEQTRINQMIQTGTLQVEVIDNKFNHYRNAPSDKPVFKSFHGLNNRLDLIQKCLSH